MKFLQFFPLNEKVIPQNTNSLIFTVVLYLVICAVLQIINILLSWVPLLGGIIGFVCWFLGLYCAIGVILAIMQYVKK